VSLNNAVGMDIELVTDKILRIHHKFINEQESDFVKPEDVIANCVAWSAKETLFKWYGKGQVDFRKNITLHPFTMSARGAIKAAFAKPDCSKLLNVEYEAGPELVMTWVVG
jgi:4'-phosphopantetheinyl transferase